MEQEDVMKKLLALKEEATSLRRENKALQNDCQLAGELGKTLLEQNKEWEKKYQEMSEEYVIAKTSVEELKQENYSLRSRREADIRTKDFQLQEMENAKRQLQKKFDGEKKVLQLDSEKTIKELHKDIKSLNTELEKYIMVESQLKEKVEQQEGMLERTREYTKKLQLAEVLENEVDEQRRACTKLQMDRDELIMEVNDMKNVIERQEHQNKTLAQQLESLQEELQEKSRQAQTWYNHLQEARGEAGEYKAELDTLKADEQLRVRREKGNSLFGEVEDRRLEMEMKYTSMKTQHECLVKTHNITKQHLHKLKNQVAALLQVKGNQADTSQMHRLTEALAQKEGEVRMLTEKIVQLEKQQNGPDRDVRKYFEAFSSDFSDKKDYVNFLEKLIDENKKKITELNKELQTKVFNQLAESDRLRRTEGQLHNAESDLERAKSENMKLKLRVEDLKSKLQNALKNNKNPDKDVSLSQSVRMSKTRSAICLRSQKQRGILDTSSHHKQPSQSHSSATPDKEETPPNAAQEETSSKKPAQKSVSKPGIKRAASVVMPDRLSKAIQEFMQDQDSMELSSSRTCSSTVGVDLAEIAVELSPPSETPSSTRFNEPKEFASDDGASRVRFSDDTKDGSKGHEDKECNVTVIKENCDPQVQEKTLKRSHNSPNDPVVVHVSSKTPKNECHQQ
ncbi:protein Spindly [Nematostella vectensis]|uniref:protein Spindly n=1 Tax=Nematostella vectensis TaxID=45351 RepID=UPI00138FCCF6|nr:protein Spindly [Nematostella vectensis]